MENKLAIDIGNTRTKIGIFDNSVLKEVLNFENNTNINSTDIILQHHIHQAIISSTIQIPSHILEEMKTILKYQSYLSFEGVLTWATLNGAKALGFDAVLGSIEVHKMPGLVWIDNIENGMLTNQSSSKRII